MVPNQVQTAWPGQRERERAGLRRDRAEPLYTVCNAAIYPDKLPFEIRAKESQDVMLFAITSKLWTNPHLYDSPRLVAG